MQICMKSRKYGQVNLIRIILCPTNLKWVLLYITYVYTSLKNVKIPNYLVNIMFCWKLSLKLLEWNGNSRVSKCSTGKKQKKIWMRYIEIWVIELFTVACCPWQLLYCWFVINMVLQCTLEVNIWRTWWRNQCLRSINLTHYHIFPWLCAWDACYIIFCNLLHIHSVITGILFSLSLCSLW